MASQALALYEDENDQKARRLEAWEKIKAAVTTLIMDLEGKATDRVARRNGTELRWLQDLRQYHGIYEAAVQNALNVDEERSKIFINITRPKTTSWEARLSDMLFPNDDKNWGINPTPVPDLVESARAAATEAEQLEAQAQDAVDQNNEMVDQGASADQRLPVLAKAHQLGKAAAAKRQFDREVRATMEEAARRCQAMEREIDDQLTESLYPSRCRDVIQDACKLGTGILKGPFTATKPRKKWMRQDDGVYVLDAQRDARPEYRRVDPWSFFPDPDATSMENNEDTLERHLLNKRQLRTMAKMLGFHAPTVKEILNDSPLPMVGGDLNWLNELRALEGQTVTGTISRYIVWEWHGSLEIEQITTMMRVMGRFDEADEFEENADPLEERMVIVYFAQGQLLKIAEEFPLDSGDSLYSVFNFERAEASVLGGVGVQQRGARDDGQRRIVDRAADRHRQDPDRTGERRLEDGAAQGVEEDGRRVELQLRAVPYLQHPHESGADCRDH